MAIKYNLKTAGPNLTSREIQEIPFATLTGVDVEYAENGEYTVNPPTGFDGLSSVNVTVDVPTTTLGSTTVNPSTSQQVIEAATGTGFDTITVNAVTAAIDSNITAGNIKKDVEILGITGTFDPTPTLETVTAGYTANGTYTITASTGYDGISSVEVTVDVAGGASWGQQLTTYYSIFASNTTMTGADLTGFVGSTLATSAYHMFEGCSNLESVPLFDTSNITNAAGMFMYCTSLQTIPSFDFSNITSCGNMFRGCSNLTTLPQLNTPNVPGMDRMFENCSSLTNVGGFAHLGKAFTSSQTVDLSYSSRLTYQSIMNIINNLEQPDAAGVTPTLHLATAVYNLLSAEDIAIATGKGWSVTH